MSALPKAVQRQARQAEKAHAKAYGAVEAEAPAVNDPPPASTEVTETPVVQPVDTGAEATPAPAPEAPAQPLEEAAPASSLETTGEPFQGGQEPSKKVEEETDRWEHKYAVLNGKYKAEVPRLHKQIRELNGEVHSLQGLIASLEKPNAAVVAPDGADGNKLLKDEEIDDYGEDLIGVVKRAAREELTPELQRLFAENTQLKNQAKSVVEQRAVDDRESVYDVLDDEVENWLEINSSQEYLQWLRGVDVYSGLSRQDMLSEAFKTNDAARVVTFFKGYLKENAAVQPGTPAPVERQPQVDMASLAAPGATKAAATRAPEGQRMWKQREISAFYRDVQKGKYRGKDSEKHRVEQDIIKAGQEGRVTA